MSVSVFDHERPEESRSTGLCLRPWCNDEALPDEEFCRPCLEEIEAELDDHDPPEAA